MNVGPREKSADTNRQDEKKDQSTTPRRFLHQAADRGADPPTPEEEKIAGFTGFTKNG